MKKPLLLSERRERQGMVVYRALFDADERSGGATGVPVAHTIQRRALPGPYPGQTVTLAYVDHGYRGQQPAQAAAEHGIALHVVKVPQAKRGFLLLPKRWVVKSSSAWAARFQRLTREYERLTTTLEVIHNLVFACLTLGKANQINLLSY